VRKGLIWAARGWPVVLLAAVYAASAVGLTLVARLARDAPLLLLALRPTWSIMLLVGGSVPFLVALLIAVPLRALVRFGYFGVARHDLRSVLALRPGGRRLVDALSRRSTERALLYFCLINANPAVAAALGGGKVSWLRFGGFVTVGMTLQTSAYLLAARAVSPWGRTTVAWLDGHATAAILLLASLGVARVVAKSLSTRARRARAARDLPDAAGVADDGC
jgi:prepilin-type processing-associated H-X9-DG protein